VKGLGEGVAFAGLCAGAAWLEVSSGSAGDLWLMVVVWAVLTDWGKK